MASTTQSLESTNPTTTTTTTGSTEQFRTSRPTITGPDVPSSPFPIALHGPVQKGYGRGGKDLGCPTANLPDEALPAMSDVTGPGVYYGYAQVLSTGSPSSITTPSPSTSPSPSANSNSKGVQPMVMSLGWNPFYKNEKMSAEIHIMHDYPFDFYGEEMRVVVLGFIRPELDYTSREDLIQDIEVDKQVALNSLARPAYAAYHSLDTFSALFPSS